MHDLKGSSADRLVTVNSILQSIYALLDHSMQPTTTVAERFKTSAIVGYRRHRIDKTLDQIEAICDDYQPLIDEIRQAAANLALFNHTIITTMH